jgi:PAS domain S-box-containing protein
MPLKKTKKATANLDDVTNKDKSMSTAILSDSKSHLLQVQKMAQIASWELDLISGDLSWSEGVFDIFDIPQGTALTYEDFLQMILPEDREYVERQWQAALNGDLYDIEHRIRVGKEVKWVRENAVLEFDKKGRAIRGVGIVQDITGQKELVKELHRAKINYRMIADFTYDWEWWMQPDDTFKYMSPACERITGYKAEQFVENSSLLREIIVPEDRDKWDKHDDGTHKDSGLQEMQFRIKRADGDVRWIEHACQPVFSRENEFLGFRASNRDITERKHFENDLRDSRKKYRALVDDALIGVFNSWINGKFIFVNDALVRMFDFDSPEQMLAEGVVARWSDPGQREQFLSLLHKHGSVNNFEGDNITRTGRKIHVLISARLHDDSISGMVMDVTERQLMDFQLKKSFNEIEKLKNLLEEESGYLREEINLTHNFKNIIGNSDAIKYVLFKVEQVSESDTNVLVLGETGTGKELIARAIHNNSPRSNRPLIKVNCAALPSHLIESELFGHEKGSFTSADSMHKGRFEIADGSSLFLDEIGELPLELQAKLLRVIEDGEFERLGGSKTMKVDVRIITATNRNLEKDVSERRFRADLWYRLNVFPITIPPLRERRDDIPLLVEYYLDFFNKKQGKHIASIPVRIIKAMESYNWPGNVRELANIIERSVISTSGSKLQLAEKLKQHNGMGTEEFKSFHDMERDYILKVLEKTSWKIGGANSAAEILRLDRSTLRNKMKKLDIRKP